MNAPAKPITAELFMLFALESAALRVGSFLLFSQLSAYAGLRPSRHISKLELRKHRAMLQQVFTRLLIRRLPLG
jgi:hypothetical protein